LIVDQSPEPALANIQVATLNFHFAQNYGAVLQAIALQDRLESLGAEVRVIDYRPPGHSQHYAPLPNPVLSAVWKFRGATATGASVSSAAKQALARAIRSVLLWKTQGQRRSQARRFESYRSRHFEMTRRYKSMRQLRATPPEADVYVVGSDQVWNPTNMGGIDPAYFLSFGAAHVVRAGYAVSTPQLDPARHQRALASLVPPIDHLSLREPHLMAPLSKLATTPVQLVPDPVMLMTASDFQKYSDEASVPRRPYLLLYAVNTHSTRASLIRLVNHPRASLSVEVVDVSLEPAAWPFPVTRPVDLTPGTFLSYISEARFVVSNSFHATAFSLLYQRDFAVVSAPGTGGRMSELLTRVRLTERIVSEQTDLSAFDTPIDYRDVEIHLTEMRSRGMSFLHTVVDESENRRRKCVVR